MPDWPAIRHEYEQGVSQSTLARMHGITQQAISKRVRKEGWEVLQVVPEVVSPTTGDDDLQPTSETVDLARVVLRGLARYAKMPLDLKEYKLLCDSLSQLHKIIVLSQPAGQQTNPLQGLDLSQLTDQELAQVELIMRQVEARKAEQDEKIIPMRKMS